MKGSAVETNQDTDKKYKGGGQVVPGTKGFVPTAAGVGGSNSGVVTCRPYKSDLETIEDLARELGVPKATLYREVIKLGVRLASQGHLAIETPA